MKTEPILRRSGIALKIAGLLALIWFLIRVIPKPSRATYPCQRAAFPLASAFVIWITGLISGKYFFKKAKEFFAGANYFLVAIFLSAAVFSFSLITIPYSTLNASFFSGASAEVFEPTDNPNTPVGNASGIFPGRVVWCYNPNATNWSGGTRKWSIDGKSGATEIHPGGEWYLEGNIIQSQVDLMISETIRKLSGKISDALAWDAIFRYFNSTHQRGEKGYVQGEKITVKINLNNTDDHGEMDGATNISPQMVLGLLRQLVNEANVPAANITFYDVSRHIPSTIFDLCKKEFSDVNFVDKDGGEGRIKGEPDTGHPVNWSQTPELEPLANPAFTAYLPTCVTEADYIINFANLKAHSLAGISICAKNMLGSFIAPNTSGLQPPQAAGIHPYIAARTSDGYVMRPMASYNSLVDLMGDKDLGGKTLLFLVDGLFAATSQGVTLDYRCKWESSPFNGNWTSSLFASMDMVAIESVCLDFLRAEQAVSDEMTNVTGNIDNFLHEAAQANNPPSGTFYHPGSNERLESLGVHEHWNNAQDKKYTRNLGTGTGIELIPIIHVWGSTSIDPPVLGDEIEVYPNPASDIINVRLSYKYTGNVKVEIFSIAGSLVYNEIFFAKENTDDLLEINIGKFSGLLILKVSQRHQTFSRIIIRQLH